MAIYQRRYFPEVVREEITTSLPALRTDYIDVLLLRHDNQEMPVADILATLNNELVNGRVHAFGASNWEYRRLTGRMNIPTSAE